MPYLHLDSVLLSYSDHVVLSDVSLTVKKGEVIGLVGRNGCGKSSLLHVLFGVIDRASRHVQIDGRYYKHPFKSKDIFLVPQSGFGIPYLTPRKLSYYFDADSVLLQTEPLIRRVWDQRFSELSGGEAKYAELLVALYSSRSYVLLDEPFSYLSPVMVEQLKAQIKLVSARKGILLTDHQYEHVLAVADRQYVLTGGILRSFITKEELVQYGYIK